MTAVSGNFGLGTGRFSVFQFFVFVTHLPAADGSVALVGGEPAGSAMPRPSPHSIAFEPAHIEAMRKAFDAVCARLELSAGTEDPATKLVALKIIELARAGEQNAERLTVRALAEFGVGNDGSSWRH
jgi:hypothetical protein